MVITNWFRGLFNKNNTIDLSSYCGSLAGDILYKELAIQASISLITNSIVRSEFLTFVKGKEHVDINYYMLNVQANQNTSSSKFWSGVVKKLIYESECLVIMQDDMLYIADSFQKRESAFIENVYKDIVIKNYNLDNIYTESQVLHFEWHDDQVMQIINNLNDDYSKLIQASSKGFKRGKGKKGSLEIPASYPQTPEGNAELQDLMDNKFKKYFEAEGDALVPLTNGIKYNERGSEKGSQSSDSSREIRGFVDDIFDFVAMGLRIPPNY